MPLYLSGAFSGSNYLSVANYTGNPAAFSVSHWVYPNTAQLSRIFFANFLTGGTNKGWATGISDATNNKVKFYLGTNTLLQTGTLTSAVWTHVICTWDGTTASLYLNGNTTPDNTLTSGVVYGATPTNNYIGSLDGTNQDWNGRLAGVGYWSKALSTTEVSNLYNGGYGLLSGDLTGSLLTSLVSYLDFMDSSSLGRDNSGNGHNYANTGTVAQAFGPYLGWLGYNGPQQPRGKPVLQRPWALDTARAQTFPYYGALGRDSASNVTTSIQTSGTAAWTKNAYGPCLNQNDSTGQQGLNLGTPVAHGATEFTLSSLALLDTNTGGNTGLRLLWAEETVASANMRFGMSGGLLFFQVGVDGAFTNLSIELPPLNIPVVITCRLTTAGVRSIWYGPYKISQRTDASCVWGSGTGSLVLGTSAQALSRNWSGQINGGYVSTRAWSDTEIIAVSRDFFAPVRTPKYDVLSSPFGYAPFAAALLPAM